MGFRENTYGTGVCDPKKGACDVSFSWFVGWSEPNYKIIDTDYKSYSIVYECDSSSESLLFLTREPVPAPALI